jgi:hypothetical protein
VALGLAGGAVWAHLAGVGRQDELAALVIPNTGGAVRPEDADRAKELRAGIDSAAGWRLGLAAGAVAAGAGSGILFFLAPASGGQAALAPAISMAGRF